MSNRPRHDIARTVSPSAHMARSVARLKLTRAIEAQRQRDARLLPGGTYTPRHAHPVAS